jgi:hypothetical protein
MGGVMVLRHSGKRSYFLDFHLEVGYNFFEATHRSVSSEPQENATCYGYVISQEQAAIEGDKHTCFCSTAAF